MKKLCLLFLVGVPFLTAKSDEPAPAGFEHWSGGSLHQGAQALATEAAGNPHHSAVKQLADFPNDLFLLSHREADGQVEWHETQADVFFVESGSATLVVGTRCSTGRRWRRMKNATGPYKGQPDINFRPGTWCVFPRACRTNSCSMERRSSATL